MATELFGVQFTDPREIRRKQNQLLLEQIQSVRPKGQDAGSVGGFGLGMAISGIMNRMGGPSQEELQAKADNEVLKETMKQLQVSESEARSGEDLPAGRAAQFSETLADNFFNAGEYDKAATLMAKSEELRAKEMAQKQLKVSTEIAEAAEAERIKERLLADQRILVRLDQDGNVVGQYQEPGVNEGESIIQGATTSQGMAAIASELAKAQEMGHTVVPMTMEQFVEETLDIAKEGKNYGVSEQKKMRQEVLDQQSALFEGIPLITQLVEDPDALQGVAMSPDGKMKAGPVAGVFSWLQNTGEQFRKGAVDAGILSEEEAIAMEDQFLQQALDEAGVDQSALSGNVARGRVIGLAYAIARARDSGGRLSDQDVALALRSLTGQGGAREIAALFGDFHRSAVNKVTMLQAAQGDQEILRPEVLQRFDQTQREYRGLLDQLDAAGAELQQPQIPGEAGGGFDLEYDPETGQMVPAQ